MNQLPELLNLQRALKLRIDHTCPKRKATVDRKIAIMYHNVCFHENRLSLHFMVAHQVLIEIIILGHRIGAIVGGLYKQLHTTPFCLVGETMCVHTTI